jgi:hypothetical protein
MSHEVAKLHQLIEPFTLRKRTFSIGGQVEFVVLLTPNWKQPTLKDEHEAKSKIREAITHVKLMVT